MDLPEIHTNKNHRVSIDRNYQNHHDRYNSMQQNTPDINFFQSNNKLELLSNSMIKARE